MSDLSRRRFLKTAAAGSLAAAAPVLAQQTAPAARTSDKSGSGHVVGRGERQYRIEHDHFRLPGEYSWQITHNVAVGGDGLVYVIHEGETGKPDHPAVFVFDPDGTFVRAFGSHLQGGGHGLEVRNEGGEDFLYVTAYQGLKFWEKLTTTGQRVWRKRAPMSTGLYAEGEAENPQKEWGRDRFMPTNTAFLSDGRYVLGDGYGAHVLHVYSADGDHLSVVGKPGKADGEFNLPHGHWIDDRDGTEKIVVADRANNRLQWFTPEGEHLRTQDGFLLPANIDVRGDDMLVPELKARITILGADNEPVCVIGDDDWRPKVLADGNALRRNPSSWRDGKLLHPHDACFDADGNILLAEWVATGRVSRLVPV